MLANNVHTKRIPTDSGSTRTYSDDSQLRNETTGGAHRNHPHILLRIIIYFYIDTSLFGLFPQQGLSFFFLKGSPLWSSPCDLVNFCSIRPLLRTELGCARALSFPFLRSPLRTPQLGKEAIPSSYGFPTASASNNQPP